MTLRVVLADDEAPARRKLVRFLGGHADIEIAGEAADGLQAVDLIAAADPDVVFLDIHMPGLDGLGVAEQIAQRERTPAIVFVTAFDRYAVRAFDVAALDYLLKPYDRERFERTLDRARHSRERPALKDGALASVLSRARSDECYARRILIPNDGRSFFLPVSEVVRLEASGNNVVVHAKRGKYAFRSTLESLEERLDPAAFARIHRSHIVNIEEIAEIRPWFHGDYNVLLRDGTEIAWSRRYAAKRPDLFE